VYRLGNWKRGQGPQGLYSHRRRIRRQDELDTQHTQESWESHIKVSSEKLKGRPLGRPRHRGRIIWTSMFEKWGVDWINMTEDKVRSKKTLLIARLSFSLSLCQNITKPKAYKNICDDVTKIWAEPEVGNRRKRNVAISWSCQSLNFTFWGDYSVSPQWGRRLPPPPNTHCIGAGLSLWTAEESGKGNTDKRPVLEPTRANQPRREADHSPPSSVEVKNGGAIPPFPHSSSWRALPGWKRKCYGWMKS
jgi:hypothetical protein